MSSSSCIFYSAPLVMRAPFIFLFFCTDRLHKVLWFLFPHFPLCLFIFPLIYGAVIIFSQSCLAYSWQLKFCNSAEGWVIFWSRNSGLDFSFHPWQKKKKNGWKYSSYSIKKLGTKNQKKKKSFFLWCAFCFKENAEIEMGECLPRSPWRPLLWRLSGISPLRYLAI